MLAYRQARHKTSRFWIRVKYLQRRYISFLDADRMLALIPLGYGAWLFLPSIFGTAESFPYRDVEGLNETGAATFILCGLWWNWMLTKKDKVGISIVPVFAFILWAFVAASFYFKNTHSTGTVMYTMIAIFTASRIGKGLGDSLLPPE